MLDGLVVVVVVDMFAIRLGLLWRFLNNEQMVLEPICLMRNLLVAIGARSAGCSWYME